MTQPQAHFRGGNALQKLVAGLQQPLGIRLAEMRISLEFFMSTHIIPTLYGDLSVPDWPDDLIVRALQLHGEWAETEVRLLAQIMPQQANFWDVGAFLGTFSIGVARHCALASVLAVEANPTLGASLVQNLSLNLKVPAQIVNAGVGPKEGWLTPQCDPVLVSNHGSQAYDFSDRQTPNAIRCQSLRQLRHLYGDYDAIKLDIEGMERDVLLNDQDYIIQHQPVIWVECNETLASLDLFAALKWMGYAPLYLAFPAFRRGNHFVSTDLIYPMAYEAALLAAPSSLLETFAPDIAGEDVICRPISTGFDLRKALYDTPRWSQPDWVDMSRAELIARMGRMTRSSALKDFLRPAPTGPGTSIPATAKDA
jgi:FkbM family methyltransferase